MNTDDLDRLVTRAENRLTRSWRAFVRDVLDANSLQDIEAAVAAGDLSRLLDGVDVAAESIAADINGAFVASGQRTARWLDGEVSGAVRHSLTNDQTIDWMADQTETFVRAMASEQLDTAEAVMRIGRRRGWSDRRIAEEIRGSIGLGPSHVETIDRYRTALESGDVANALGRELADGRYDAALRRVRRGELTLGEERIDAMVDAYRRNWVRSRGKTIATREALGAVHAGVDDALRQAVKAGLIPYASQTWITRGDHKVRHSHRTMNGQQQNYGEPFVSGYGNALRYPGDEEAPASETVNCRCLLVPSLQPVVNLAA